MTINIKRLNLKKILFLSTIFLCMEYEAKGMELDKEEKKNNTTHFEYDDNEVFDPAEDEPSGANTYSDGDEIFDEAWNEMVGTGSQDGDEASSEVDEDWVKVDINNSDKFSPSENINLKVSALSQNIKKESRDYMELCKSIYTVSSTRRSAEYCAPSVKKKLNEIKRNKETIERYCQNLLSLSNKWDAILTQPTIIPGTLFPVLNPPINQQLPNLREAYKAWFERINSFLPKIGRDPLIYQNLEDIDSAREELEDIKVEIDDIYSFYYRDEKLTNQGIVAASFLTTAKLFDDKKKKITVLDVGFRNQDECGGIFAQLIDPLCRLKDNPVARFGEDGEVDYIAYLEEDLTLTKEDKLVIVYSGSNGKFDWQTNFNFGHQGFQGLFIHEGLSQLVNRTAFYSNHNTLRNRIAFYYQSHRKPNNLKITATGHSLGGALALLTAYYYKLEDQLSSLSDGIEIGEDAISVKTFTFGMPPMIGPSSKDIIERTLGKENIFRVWTRDDAVVNLTDNSDPLSIFFQLFQEDVHVGTSIPLFNIHKQDCNWLDNTYLYMGPHQIDRYPSDAHHNDFSESNLSSSNVKLIIKGTVTGLTTIGMGVVAAGVLPATLPTVGIWVVGGSIGTAAFGVAKKYWDKTTF